MAGNLTIVIPTFNCAQYLSSAIVSAMACGRPKILVVDDGSEDNTLDVAMSFKRKYQENICVASNSKNLGMTANWQQALNKVDTEYCLKLDGDDLILCSYVSDALEFLDNNTDVAIIAGRATRIDDRLWLDAQVGQIESHCSKLDRARIRKMAGKDACAFALTWPQTPASSSTIYRMSAWRSVGGFDTQLNWCSDHEIWFRLAKFGAVAYYEGPAALRRVHESNVSSDYGRRDRYCYELDLMYCRSRQIWPNAELAPLFRRKMQIVTKAYFGSAWRSLNRNPREVPERLAHGLLGLMKLARLVFY